MTRRARSRAPSVGVIRAEPVSEAVAELGEGPRWDPERRALVWLDVPRMLMHRIDQQGIVTSVSLTERISAIGMCASGRRYVAATESGFGFVEPTTGAVESIANVEEPARARMNDGGIDPEGRFFAGSVSVNPAEANGSLHCLRPDGSAERVFGDVRLSNGIGWSADGRSMYFVHSLRGSLDRFEYDLGTGRPRGRRSIVVFARAVGIPDGLCVDQEDHIWVALWGEGRFAAMLPRASCCGPYARHAGTSPRVILAAKTLPRCTSPVRRSTMR